jgi:3-oxoacyl-[acyl-carrier protein] reductase
MVEDVRRTGMRRFEGKSVIVTGGASGIGEATAARFLAEGARVLIMDVSAENIAAATPRLESVARELGGELYTHRGDVTQPDDVDAMVRRALDLFGRLDVLIDNAGIAYEEPFLEIPLEHWDRTIAVNLRGMFLVGQRVAREMARERHGTIVLSSSTNGLVGEDKYAHYNASKGGVTLLTKSMAIELGPYNIRVNAVCPGYIVTPLAASIDSPEFMAAYAEKLPLRRLGKPEEVAALFAFLASDDAAFITGETVVIDGGQLTY